MVDEESETSEAGPSAGSSGVTPTIKWTRKSKGGYKWRRPDAPTEAVPEIPVGHELTEEDKNILAKGEAAGTRKRLKLDKRTVSLIFIHCF